jgi:hypothetical protein
MSRFDTYRNNFPNARLTRSKTGTTLAARQLGLRPRSAPCDQRHSQ